MVGTGEGDHLDPLLQIHNLDALRGAAVGGDAGGRHADDHAGVVDDQHVVLVADHLDPHHWTGFLGDIIALQAKSAPLLGPVGADILVHVGALAVAVFGDHQHLMVPLGPGGPHHVVAGAQVDAPDAGGVPAHAAHVGLLEADGHAVVGDDQDGLVAVGLPHADELIPLVQGDAADARLACSVDGGELDALDGAAAGDHYQIAVLGEFPQVDHGGDLFILLDGQHIDQVGAPGGAARLGDLIALFAVDPALVGEKEDEIVGGGGEHGVHIVLLLGGHGGNALAAPALGLVGGGGGALDVAAGGEGEDALLLLDEILDVDLVLHVLDLGHPVVAVPVPDGGELVLEHAADLLLTGEQLIEVGDARLQLLVFVLQLLLLQPLEPLELHVQDGLGLHVAEAEAVHQVLLGVVVALPDGLDHRVDVVLGNQQALQQMGPLLGLAQIVAGAADDDLLLEGDVLVQDVAQGEDLGLGLAAGLHQGQHIDGEGGLELGLCKQAVEHHLGIGVPLELDDHPHAVAVGLIPDVGDALQPLVLHLVGHVLDEHALVDLVGDLGDDDAGAVVAELLKLGAGPDAHPAPAGGVGRPDAGAAHDDPPGGEVGALHVLHQVGQLRLRVVQHADRGIDYFPQVVGRNIGGHAHGDAGGAVDQQIGEPGGQYPGFLPALVEVRVPVHRVLLDLPQHFVGDLGHAGLGVTVGGRGIAVDGAEVAVAVHQRVAHGEILGQAHQGIVHRSVAMGVVAAQHVAHAGGRLLEGLVRGQVVLIHGVEDAPVDRLQAVPHVGQRPAHDDAHGVLDVALLHLVHQIGGLYLLVWKPDFLRIILWLFTHVSASQSS